MSKNTEKTGGKKKSKVKFHDVPNVLRQKIGTGGLDPSQIAQAEKVIDTNKADFVPLAQEILGRLKNVTAAVRKKDHPGRADVRRITGPIMEIKAAGGMFNYMLASEVAAVILDFLEPMEKLDADALGILDMNQRALEAIVALKLKGNGGEAGQKLAKELYDACSRYHKKHGKPGG